MSQEFTYKGAGVDIKEAADLVGDIGELRRRTEGKRSLMGAFGLFAATYDLSEYRQPVIMTGCDGVGTKVELLIAHDQLEIAGKDLVAMNVNDILTTGGDPLLFLDYIGIGRIDKAKINRLIFGMTQYLADCNCILAGGETAEMPGIVPDGLIELSGFCIGAAEKSDLVDPSRIAVGDVLIGYPSDGFHANGWSLIRRILQAHPDLIADEEWGEFLTPTRLYHDVVAGLKERKIDIKAMAHITGGGLPENLGRLFDGKGADLVIPRWNHGPVGRVLSFVSDEEAIDTFNMGWGWVAIVPPDQASAASDFHPGARKIGEITETPGVRVRIEE